MSSIQVDADATRIEQVITNLVSNAVRYSPTGAPITVSVQAQHGEVRVEVADRGPGVPPEQRQNLFERYYQSNAGDDPATGNAEGGESSPSL